MGEPERGDGGRQGGEKASSVDCCGAILCDEICERRVIFARKTSEQGRPADKSLPEQHCVPTAVCSGDSGRAAKLLDYGRRALQNICVAEKIFDEHEACMGLGSISE